MNKFIAMALISTLALAACKEEESSEADTAAKAYEIDCGLFGKFSITYQSDEAATLTMNDKTFDLKRAVTASGVNFVNDEISAWEHQGKMYITDLPNEESKLTCAF